MITFQNVHAGYGDEKVLRDTSFKIIDGDFVLLTGKSGAGKTTVVNLILGTLKPLTGSVRVNDLVIENLSGHDLQLYRRTIGVVFQDYKLLPKKTVFENVAFALEVCGKSEEEIKKEVPKSLKLVDLLSSAQKFPHELSGGEKQRVSIARAMVHKPQVLIADEPTGNLDDYNTAEIVKLLSEINRKGTTVILATHDQQIVNSLKKRVLTVEKGRVL